MFRTSEGGAGVRRSPDFAVLCQMDQGAGGTRNLPRACLVPHGSLLSAAIAFVAGYVQDPGDPIRQVKWRQRVMYEDLPVHSGSTSSYNIKMKIETDEVDGCVLAFGSGEMQHTNTFLILFTCPS